MKYTWIYWLDSTTRGIWHIGPPDELAMDCISCGVLVAETKEQVIITDSVGLAHGDKDTNFHYPHAIPKRAILYRRDFDGPPRELRALMRKRGFTE